MRVEAVNLSKSFQYRKILSGLEFIIEPGQHVAVTGPNGSGKSTLLKIIAGFLSPSEGMIKYLLPDKVVPRGDVWKYLTFIAPYIDLIPAFTIEDFIYFYTRLKPLQADMSLNQFLKNVHLYKHKDKDIDNLSSGMLQRLKLGLCFFTESQLLILDEPGTNLDSENHQWYLDCLKRPDTMKKTCIIASNETKDLGTCVKEIQVGDKKYLL